MDFFPFNFKFEPDVAEFIYPHMVDSSTPGTIAFHHGKHSGRDINHKELPKKLVTKINEELLSHNLPGLASLNAWRREPGEVQVMHVDVYAWDKIFNKGKFAPNKVAFNIPISNTQDSWMKWYGSDHELKETKIITPTGAHSTYYDIVWKEEIREDSKLELTTSHFVRTDKPHRVFANSQGLRIVASLRLLGNPSIQQVHDILFKQ